MSKETRRYPDLHHFENGPFYTTIPLIDDFEEAIKRIEGNSAFREKVERVAQGVTKSLGLEVQTLSYDKRGLFNISVFPGDCACIGITGDSWDRRNRRTPEFSTHNVDTANQYVALTSIVFYYLNNLQELIVENSL